MPWKPYFKCMPDSRKGLQFLGSFSVCWVLPVLFSSFPAVTVCVIACRIQKEVSMCAWTRFWDLEGSTSRGITGKQDSVSICTWNDMWKRWDLCLPEELPQHFCVSCAHLGNAFQKLAQSWLAEMNTFWFGAGYRIQVLGSEPILVLQLWDESKALKSQTLKTAPSWCFPLLTSVYYTHIVCMLCAHCA